MTEKSSRDREFRYQSDLTHANFETLSVRAGQMRTFEHEHSEPIFPTSSFVFNSAEEAAARFSGESEGNVYSRYTNPTVRVFEQRLASLEGAEMGVAAASGMASILSVCLAYLSVGDEIVSSRSIFGTTNVLFDKYLSRLGISTRYAKLNCLKDWEECVSSKTKLFFLESPSNPLAEIADIQGIAEIAKAHGCLLVVDNCFCTPALQKPISFGADIVIHSATKYIDGQGRCIGGAAVGSEEHMKEVLSFLRSAGPTLSAFNAWVFLKGLETLNIRMKAHSEHALQVSQWLIEQPKVERVYYSGLTDHPQHLLAKKQQKAFGGVLSFEIKGDQKAAWKFVDATRMMSITANLGDAKTTVTHPATTTHCRLSPEQRIAAGINNNLIRIAVGLEDPADIIADIDRGLMAL